MPTNDHDAERLRADFLRFRERGDVAALARVFDALGPRLLLLAAHLCRGADQAEDLVQNTFLDAMRSARGFERERDLEAWLAGILRNRAVDGARRRERRREVEGESLEVVEDPQPGPVDEALSAERVEVLRRAIAGLPATYREVAVLRVVHGLEPIEIARALGRSAGTVRMQCHRAVEQLRRALPAGWVGALVIPVRPWSDVRAAVLGAGQEIAATTVVAGVAWSGVLMMAGKKWAMVLVAAAVGLGALWVGSGWRPGDAGSAAAPAGVARTAAGEDEARRDGGAGRVASATETLVDRRSVEQPGGGDKVWPGVLGRCVDANGVPIEGVPIRVRARQEVGGHVADTDGPRRIHSDPEGRFVWRGSLPPGRHQLKLSFEDERYCWCGIEVALDGAERFRDLGEVVLPRGVRVHGRVVDEDGRPVAAVRVRATAWTIHDPELFVQPWSDDTAATDEDGRFGPMQRLAPKSGSLWLQVEGRKLIGPGEVSWDGVREEQAVELVLAALPERPTVEGVVVDPSGQPIAGARVDCRSASNRGANSGADGRFEIEASVAAPSDPPVLVLDRRGRATTRVETAWGTRGLRIVMEPLPGLRLRVVRADSEAPVLRYAVTVLYDSIPRVEDMSNLMFARRFELDRREDGELLIEEPFAHAFALRIEAADEQLAASPFVQVPAAAERPPELMVALEPRADRRLRVVSAEGDPLGGVEVECIDAVGGPVNVGTEAFSWDRWEVLTGGFHKALTLGEGVTDERGELLLDVAADRDVHLRLRGGGAALQVHGPLRFDDRTELEIVATPEAVWQGAIRPPELARDLVRMSSKPDGVASDDSSERGLELLPLEGGLRLRRFLDPLVPFGDDGRFELRALPAGRYRVRLHAGGQKVDAARIELRAGEVSETDLDLTPLWPSRLELAVLVDGVAAADRPAVTWLSRVKLPHEERDGLQAVVQDFVRLDATGSLTCWSFPGLLEIDLRLPGQKLWSGPLEIPAGVAIGRSVELRTAALELLVETGDGAPAAHCALQVGQGEWGLTDAGYRTDEAGRLSISSLAAGSYRVRARPPGLRDPEALRAYREQHGSEALRDAWSEVGVLQVEAGPEPSRHELRLPLR